MTTDGDDRALHPFGPDGPCRAALRRQHEAARAVLDHRIGTPESVDDTAMRTARIAVLLLAVALLAVGFGQSVDGVALARGSDTASELETERFHRNEPKVYRVKRTTPRHDDRPRKLRGEVVYKGPKFLAHLFTPRSPPDEEDEE